MKCMPLNRTAATKVFLPAAIITVCTLSTLLAAELPIEDDATTPTHQMNASTSDCTTRHGIRERMPRSAKVFVMTKDGKLVVNRIFPRTSNASSLTLDAKVRGTDVDLFPGNRPNTDCKGNKAKTVVIFLVAILVGIIVEIFGPKWLSGFGGGCGGCGG